MIPGVKLIDDILKSLPENARLREQLGELRAQIEVLQTENDQLKTKVDQLTPKADQLDPKALQILKFYFDESEDIAAEYIAGRFGVTMGVAEYHIDTLRERELITLVGVAPAIHAINSNGRKYVMQHNVA